MMNTYKIFKLLKGWRLDKTMLCNAFMYLMHAFVQETIIFIMVEEFQATTVNAIIENICEIMEANQIIVR